MNAIVVSLLGAFFVAAAFQLICEYADSISQKLVMLFASTLPEFIRSDKTEQWIADIAVVEGPMRKIVNAIGIAWVCRKDASEKWLKLKWKKSYIICLLPVVDEEDPTTENSVIMVFERSTMAQCAEGLLTGILKKVEDEVGPVEAMQLLDESLAEYKQMTSLEKSRVTFGIHHFPTKYHIAYQIIDGRLTYELGPI